MAGWREDARQQIAVADLLYMRDGLANIESYEPGGAVPRPDLLIVARGGQQAICIEAAHQPHGKQCPTAVLLRRPADV